MTAAASEAERPPRIDYDRYKKVSKPREDSVDGEIRVAAMGSLSAYVTYAGKLFNEDNRDELSIKATGTSFQLFLHFLFASWFARLPVVALACQHRLLVLAL